MVLVTELENTLWGLALNGKNHYEHKSDRAIHISMAALDTSSTNDQYVPVMVKQGDHSYILCTLNAPNCLQQTLDLELNKGETVDFYLNGNGVVHLTGYYIQEEIIDDFNPEDADQLMGYGDENCEDEECGGHHHNGFGEFDDAEEDSDEDDDEEGDEDDDDEDDEDDMSGDEEDDEDDEDEDEEDDEEEEEEEENKPNGKKRKLETKTKELKKERKDAKKPKKEESEDEEEEDEPPKLVKANEKQQQQQKQKNNNENKNNAKQNKESQNKNKEPETKNVNGVQIKDLKAGTGPEAKSGKYVHVYYQGKLKQNGKQFDACQSGKPFKFRLGSGEVIKGWDIGVSGMKVGGKRVLTIPPHLAYANQKIGGIPPNSTLVFEVELKAVS